MAALFIRESLSGTSPVTVAGPLRICTVFLGSLKRLNHRFQARSLSIVPYASYRFIANTKGQKILILLVLEINP
jgi:hypothetical protein